jgi:hypothetical protein
MIVAAFGIEDPAWSAAAVAVIVAAVTAFATSVASGPLRYLVDRALHRSKAKTDYEYEQRKRLRAEIGGYHGRLLEAATSLNYRLGTIYAKRDRRWLDVDGDYARRWPRHYFFNSTIYRFMAFVAVANRFEREAIYIDSRIADPTDRLFVFYVKALRWTLTDTALFDGLGYGDEPVDHFYTDHLRRMCASIWKDDGEGLVDLRALEDVLAGEHELEPVLKFFDGLNPDDAGRLRWDRLVAFQLVLMAFIETFGYEIHKTDREWFDAVAGRMRPEVARNLHDWLPKLGIAKPGFRSRRDVGGRLASSALRIHMTPGHSNRLTAQAALPGGSDPQA